MMAAEEAASASAGTLPPLWRKGMHPTENGVYVGVKRPDYERIVRVNWSTLKHLKRSPAHYRAVTMEKAQEDTDAMRVGRATHVAVLEPEMFLATHAVWDGGRRYGKEWDKFQEKHAGLEILTEDQYQQVKAIADAARSNEYAAPYLRAGLAEVTLLWTHTEPANGVPGFEVECKGRIDFSANAGAIVDLKTTRDASSEGFCRSAWNLDYLAQAAFYTDGYAAAHGGELLPYLIVAIEKDAPYVAVVYRIPEHMIEMGRDTYRGLLKRLHQCRTDNHWPGYAEGIVDLELPRWMRSASDDSDLTGMGLVFPEGAVHE